MALPVTGPFTKYPSGSFEDNYQRGYRQKMPIDRPLEYKFYSYFGKFKTVSWSGSTTTYGIWTKEANFSLQTDPSYNRLRTHALNMAYEKLRSKAMDTAGWAENLAQINKSRKMINDRAVQLGKFVTALRKGRLDHAARILRTPTPSDVSHGKALAQNFLEYEYGVKPLVRDIQNSLQIITSEPFERRIRSQAHERIQKLVRSSSAFGSNPKYVAVQKETTDGFIQVRLGATFRVTSPNLLWANQLGLIDLALPWKLMPFSFVIDWFVNVEQVLSSLTDWYGVVLLDSYTSEFAKGFYTKSYFQNASYTHGHNEGYSTSWDKESVNFDRTLGIPSPTLIMKPFKGFSLNRGLQAVSLVLSVFGK
jgi:hypothetical protein